MKKIILAVIISSFILSGCSLTQSKTPTTEEKLEQNVVTKTGIISTKAGSEYLLSTSDGIVNITSNKVNLENFMKKNVSVTGMFSGSTLYVDTLVSN